MPLSVVGGEAMKWRLSSSRSAEQKKDRCEMEGSTSIQLAQRLLPKRQGAVPPAIGVQLRFWSYTLNAHLMYSLKTGVRAVIWNQSWRRLKFPLLWNGDTDVALGCFLSKDLFEVIQKCASYAEGCRYLVRRPACASQLGEKKEVGCVGRYSRLHIHICWRSDLQLFETAFVCRFQVSRLRRVKTYISPAGEAILEISRTKA
jgi:hypothetical protein